MVTVRISRNMGGVRLIIMVNDVYHVYVRVRVKVRVPKKQENVTAGCYFPSTGTENKVEIMLFSVPVPNPKDTGNLA